MSSDSVPDSSTDQGQRAEGGSEELTKFVQDLLGDMQTKFQQMSEQIIGRLDEMGRRVDVLEKNIGELMQQVDSKEEAADQQQQQHRD